MSPDCHLNRPHADPLSVSQEEFSDIYSSIVELRDESATLLAAIEQRERAGDDTEAERLRQDLNATEARLLEKNEERKARYVPNKSYNITCFDY